jgi:poly(3-hydroxyalkanoate) depolymerase
MVEMSAKKSGGSTGAKKPVISVQTIGRQQLRTAVWAGDGDKTPILFFNGIGANLELIAPLAHALPDRDIVTFDLPGIGKSPSPVIPYRPWWVAYAANTIIKRLGYEKVDVIGVSWGGGAAQQYAFQHRGRVNKLILAATSSGMTMVPGNIDALSRMATPQRYTDPNFMKENFQRLYSEDPGPSHDHVSAISAPTMRGYFYQLVAMWGWTSLPFLPFVNMPTLIMMGDKDRIVPLINGRIIQAFMPNAQLHIVEGGGHLFIVSRLKQITPVLRQFLDAPAE